MSVTQMFRASRNATWAPPLAYEYAGAALPLEGATIAMQLRLYPGQPGEPKLALGDIAFSDDLRSGSEGGADETRTLTLSPLFSVDQLTAMPGLGTPEAGNPQRFFFDIRILYSDGLSEILSEGEFILYPGVTV